MKIPGKLGCLFGRHVRSRSRVRSDGHITRSVCRHCGVAMMKTGGDWEVDRANGTAA